MVRLFYPYNHTMLKTVLTPGFACLLLSTSVGQTISSQRKEDLNIKKFDKAYAFVNPPEDSVSIPICSISVVDARPDSSAIGLYQLFKLEPRFIVTKQGFKTVAEQYLRKYVRCSNSDSFSVLMVLKKFWISVGLYKPDDRRIWGMVKDTSKKMNVSLSAKIEFYLYKDSGYYTLYRFDSVFSYGVNKSIDIAGNKQRSFVGFMIQDALETSLSKLATMDRRWQTILSSKRKFNWPEIETHESNYFNIPVLKDSTLVPGVYLTFEEFKANSPSVTNFAITKDKLNDIIYIKNADGQISIKDAWGYCDSVNQVFIRLNHNYFKLQRRQNAFYIYGSNQMLHTISDRPASLPFVSSGSSTPQYVPGGNYRSEDFELVLKPFELDWDTGRLY